MQSALFVPNNSANSFGVTGGGVNEFLIKAIDASTVTNMRIISTSPGLRAGLERADQRAKALGHGSAMDRMERDDAAGNHQRSPYGSYGTFARVGERTAQERTTPTPVDSRGQRI
jgi:hypothetical protein